MDINDLDDLELEAMAEIMQHGITAYKKTLLDSMATEIAGMVKGNNLDFEAYTDVVGNTKILLQAADTVFEKFDEKYSR